MEIVSKISDEGSFQLFEASLGDKVFPVIRRGRSYYVNGAKNYG